MEVFINVVKRKKWFVVTNTFTYWFNVITIIPGVVLQRSSTTKMVVDKCISRSVLSTGQYRPLSNQFLLPDKMQFRSSSIGITPRSQNPGNMFEKHAWNPQIHHQSPPECTAQESHLPRVTYLQKTGAFHTWIPSTKPSFNVDLHFTSHLSTH